MVGEADHKKDGDNDLCMQERLKDFGQADLIVAEKTNGIDVAERAALRRLKELNTDGLEKTMKEHQLDAVMVANNDISAFLAIGGHPGIAVPAGYYEGVLPMGIVFGGLKGYEPRLIELAYAFEHATKLRRPPAFQH